MSRSNEIWNRQLIREACLSDNPDWHCLWSSMMSLHHRQRLAPQSHMARWTPRPPQCSVTQSRHPAARRTRPSAAKHPHPACCARCAGSRGSIGSVRGPQTRPGTIFTAARASPTDHIHQHSFSPPNGLHHDTHHTLRADCICWSILLHLLVDLGAQQHAVRLELVLQRLQRHLHDLLGRVLARALHREVEVVVAHAHRDGAGHL